MKFKGTLYIKGGEIYFKGVDWEHIHRDGPLKQMIQVENLFAFERGLVKVEVEISEK